MSKQIKHNELAEIVSGLLVDPELLGELDSQAKHQAFMLDIGRVVADHCGGEANWINPPDLNETYLKDEYNSPYLSVSPNDSLPSLNKNVWAAFDPEGWEDECSESNGTDKPLTEDEAVVLRRKLMAVLQPEAISILQALVSDVNQTGGITNFSDGLSAPCADPAWTDLGHDTHKAHCYLKSLGCASTLEHRDLNYPSTDLDMPS